MGPPAGTLVSSDSPGRRATSFQIAVQWALTLPEGPAREATFREIYSNWPAKDPEGAAAFAREHGLE